MRGRKVLHVALDERFEKIRRYYDEIFMDLAKTGNLQDIGTELSRFHRTTQQQSNYGCLAKRCDTRGGSPPT